MATYNGSETYRAHWNDPVDVQRWLHDELFLGETLAFPGGRFTTADVTADIDNSLEPDVIADLHNPLSVFSEQQFETVYCDPPYSFYSEPHENWLRPLWRVATERLILQTPRKRVDIPRSEKRWYIAEPNEGSPQTNVWLFQVFDRVNNSLQDYK